MGKSLKRRKKKKSLKRRKKKKSLKKRRLTRVETKKETILKKWKKLLKKWEKNLEKLSKKWEKLLEKWEKNSWMVLWKPWKLLKTLSSGKGSLFRIQEVFVPVFRIQFFVELPRFPSP